MSADPYGTHLLDIKDKLMAVVKTASSFATHTYADFVKKVTVYPVAFVRLRRDAVRDIGPRETRHTTTFVVAVENRSSYDEAALNSIIGYVGQVIDAIEANRTLGSTHVLNTEVAEVDFTLRNDRDAIFHFAHITLQIESLRNV